MDENEVFHTILHEIGHSVGLGHSKIKGDIMYVPHQYGTVNISKNDIETKEITKGETTTKKYYIKEETLLQLFESLLTLLDNTDLSSFDNLDISLVSDILDIDDDDLMKIFKSDILRLTITNFVDDIDTIVIPKTVNTTNVSSMVQILRLDDEGNEVTDNKLIIETQELVILIRSLAVIFDDNMDLNSIGMDTFKSLSNLNANQLNTLSNSSQ